MKKFIVGACLYCEALAVVLSRCTVKDYGFPNIVVLISSLDGCGVGKFLKLCII